LPQRAVERFLHSNACDDLRIKALNRQYWIKMPPLSPHLLRYSPNFLLAALILIGTLFLLGRTVGVWLFVLHASSGLLFRHFLLLFELAVKLRFCSLALITWLWQLFSMGPSCNTKYHQAVMLNVALTIAAAVVPIALTAPKSSRNQQRAPEPQSKVAHASSTPSTSSGNYHLSDNIT
jgi:hypothetical protein